MPYLALDDRFPFNPKVAGISDRAFRLHVVALCHCAAQLTDGLVRDNAKLWANIGGNIRSYTRITSELCSAGLWAKVDGGFLIHDYLDWNANAAQIKEKRRKDRARKRAKAFDDSARSPSGNSERFHADSSGSASREVLRTSLNAPAPAHAGGAGAEKKSPPVRVNTPAADTEAYVRKLVANHVITESFELDDYDLDDQLRAELKTQLIDRG